MLEPRDEGIKKRAYAIWEEEGHPTGRDAEHWAQASSERIALEKTANGSTIDVKPKAKRKTAVAAAAVAEEKSAKPAKKTPKKAVAPKA